MKPGSYRAVLSLVLPFLERRDATRFVVSVLEGRDNAVALWVLYRDAYPLVLDEIQCVHVAAAEGCWTAMTTLLKRLAVGRHDRFSDTPLAVSAFDTAVAAHQSVGLVFPPSVLYRAVARGDLEQIEWLHNNTQYDPIEAVTRAAEARQIHIVQWLLDQYETDPRLQCGLRYEDSPVDVRAIGWIYLADEKVHYCGLSEAHGFTHRAEIEWQTDASNPEFPIAEPFAAAGDQVAIQKLLQIPDAKRVVSRYTLVRAASNGQLRLVQWVLSLSLHNWSLGTPMVEAAANGHLEVVRWLSEVHNVRVMDAFSRALEGGHLQVARLLQGQGLLSDYGLWLAAGRSMKLPVYQLLHEEWGLKLDASTARDMTIAGDRPLIEYVVEKLLPPDYDLETLVLHAAKNGTLDALEYLVDTKGQWSRKMLRAAVERPMVGLALSQWIYKAAKQRALRLDQPLEMQLDFFDIHIFVVAREAGLETALWLVENVQEISTSSLLGSEAFAPEKSSHANSDLVSSYVSNPNMRDDAAAIDALLVACLKYRSNLCTAIEWLPQWAVRADSTEGFELVVQNGHPLLFTHATRDCILTFSQRAHFMNTLLAHDGGSLYSPRVRVWATKYHLPVPFLETIDATL